MQQQSLELILKQLTTDVNFSALWDTFKTSISQVHSGKYRLGAPIVPEYATLTDSYLPFMNETLLMMIRIALTVFNFYYSGTAILMSESYWVYYISNWVIVFSMGVQALLLLSHFRSYDPYYDNLVKALFQMALPL